MSDDRPVLVVTNLVPPDRTGAFAALHARTPIELALFGGRSHHATGAVEDPGVPHRHVRQRDVRGIAAAGGHRAVVCGTAGRVALPASFLGARRARVPFVLWSALWAPVRTPAHVLAAPMLRAIHRRAGAVAAYGPHVAAYARSLGAATTVVAPQAVDQAFWTAPASAPAPRPAPFTVAWVGRPAPAKGLSVLLRAWTRLAASDTALRLIGVDDGDVRAVAGAADVPVGVVAHGSATPEEVRNLLASSDVLVVPSIATPAFREPWGLVVNEAMHQGLPVISSDMVGAAAGGLVRDGRNGVVVPAGDDAELARALVALRDDALRTELGAHARRDAAAYTFAAWAAGMHEAIDLADRGFTDR